MILEMLRWWYSTGWMQAVHQTSTWTSSVERAFSVGILFKTLFSPWRRIVSSGGRSIDEKLRAALDNFVSRCIGFVVRSIVLLAAGVAIMCAFVAGIVLMTLWPFLPLAVLYFAIRSITG